MCNTLKKGFADQQVHQRGSNYRSNWIVRGETIILCRRIDLAFKERSQASGLEVFEGVIEVIREIKSSAGEKTDQWGS